MKKLYAFVFLQLFLVIGLQAGNITLRFTSNHHCAYVPTDSILIENLTRGGSISLYHPDTTLTLVTTNIAHPENLPGELFLSQNYPNPFSGITNFNIGIPEKDIVRIRVFDLMGRELAAREQSLTPGVHQFAFHACNKQVYFLNVQSNNSFSQQMMLQPGKSDRTTSSISYLGHAQANAYQADLKDAGFMFEPGDELRFVSYVTANHGGIVSDVIVDAPQSDTDYFFDIENEEPLPPSEISGDTRVPANEADLLYTVEAVPGLSYEWTVPGGWTILEGQGSSEIRVQAGSASGNIDVAAYNGCGTSPQSTLAVTVLYSLNLAASPATGGLCTGEGLYEVGEEVSITANPASGYLFIKWTDLQDVEVSTDADYTFMMPQAHITYIAHFEIGEGPGGGVTDIDGNHYNTVNIGGLEWMASNLRTSRYRDGSEIPGGFDAAEWNNNTSGAHAIYDHSNVPGIDSEKEMVEAYGKLYNFYAVEDERGLCPVGWRVPTDAEWTGLTSYLINNYDNVSFGNVANRLKSCRQVGSPLGGDCDTDEHPRWNAHTTHYGSDDFGFAALGAGIRGGSEGMFQGIGTDGIYWTSTQFTSNVYWTRYILVDNGMVFRIGHDRNMGFSVRCVRE